jgi:exo-beta-1,3-glucanase (GH17 family)
MLRSLGLFSLVAGAIGLAWFYLGRPVAIPPALEPGAKLTCMSYTPFHGDQAPFTPNLRIPDWQIDDDLRRLSASTSCIRTYSARGAYGRVAGFAEKYGLEVLQGVWLNRNRAENRREIEAALRLVRRYPGTIKALIVGNEALLRGELSPAAIKSYLSETKRRSGRPVTYADVWEFWLRAPELASATDFVTIHILPYWEDDPVRETEAIAHVRSVREKVAAAFPGKEILVGEVGWPSRGRMREGALPSPINQARFIAELMQEARAEHWKLNLVEAYDQPWKRLLEGTVGGYWGIYDNAQREPKFHPGDPVSNHPDWGLKAALGIGAAFLVFVAFWLGQHDARRRSSWRTGAAGAAIALGAGLAFGLAAVNLPVEGEIEADRLRAAGLLVLALTVPMAAAYALARGNRLPGLVPALNPASWRRLNSVIVVLSVLLAATFIAILHVALGLVFDPRYKDFPVAGVTGPVIAFGMLAAANNDRGLHTGAVEIAAAALLGSSALFITANEGIANWQALFFSALLLLFAAALLRTKAAPS